jgi:hypothetical protein
MESLSQDIFDRIYSINWDLSRVDVLTILFDNAN